MKIELKIAIAAAFILALIYTADKYFEKQKVYEYDFRKTRWGMTIDEVKATEDAEPSWEFSSGNFHVLRYDVVMADMNATCSYDFMYGKLWSAGYSFDTEHKDKNLYIADYEKIKALLSKEYGQPDKDYHVWKNDLYKDNPEAYGTAISLDHLTLFTYWNKRSTTIGLMLSGHNSKAGVSVHFTPTNVDFLSGGKQAMESASEGDNE
ncbi:MAG: hypothetical protein CL946_04595 [Ectothiorhodospiraceae bacterium]|nr:hypothetical protein [Ectothiorhodospiraceae bacterium]